ncbi:MAG: hypothetical protein NT054_09790 [Burkholderiales bacterium]|nr:hypothetical protein [Burkholderiales bacterium]
MKQYAADPTNNYVNYAPAIGAPEHTDSIHSGVQPCATFTGSFSGSNQADQMTSASTWGSIQFIVNDGPTGSYIMGGGLASETTGQYVAKFNPLTGQQIWLTYINAVNPLPAGQWNAFGSMGVIADGTIIAAAGTTIVKLDPLTGSILKSVQLGVSPTLSSPINANFDGLLIAPNAAGVILLKSQNRPIGCPTQGNLAMTSCQALYGLPPNTTAVALDSNSLQLIDSIVLNQMVGTRGVVTKHNNRIYWYLAGLSNLERIIVNPLTSQLTVDKAWVPPSYLLPGQTAGDAPAVLGNWIIANQNGGGSALVPITPFAVSQDINLDGSVTSVRATPWGTTLPTASPTGGWSASLGSFGVDPENNMVYAQDTYEGVVGLSLNQTTGVMTTVWNRPDWRTTDYFSLVGPANQRILISQYLNPNISSSTSVLQAALYSGNYTETVEWANASTGATILRPPPSAYTPSTALGSLPNLGYGGLIYMMGNTGSIYFYKPSALSN